MKTKANYIDFNAQHVAIMLLIEAIKGIRPPVIVNSKGLNITEWIVPRRNPFGILPGYYYKVVEE